MVAHPNFVEQSPQYMIYGANTPETPLMLTNKECTSSMMILKRRLRAARSACALLYSLDLVRSSFAAWLCTAPHGVSRPARDTMVLCVHRHHRVCRHYVCNETMVLVCIANHGFKRHCVPMKAWYAYVPPPTHQQRSTAAEGIGQQQCRSQPPLAQCHGPHSWSQKYVTGRHDCCVSMLLVGKPTGPCHTSKRLSERSDYQHRIIQMSSRKNQITSNLIIIQIRPLNYPMLPEWFKQKFVPGALDTSNLNGLPTLPSR